MRSLVWLVVVLLVLPGVAVFAFGMPLGQIVLLEALATVVVGVIALRPRVSEQTWWPRALAVDPGRGARREIARLSWSVSDRPDRPVGRLMVLRLQRIAARRLERLGLRIDDPADRDAIIARLGPDVVQALDPDRPGDVALAVFARAVAATEALATDPHRTDSPGGVRR